ncbi:hypothetical protein SDC9_155700 [bioreactor metagenome]|uniref:Uncharacterized protein n=1 Tax=bioreactor metagenome TaxID=1076179 RepID=A0A645F269_9ZZZZ
MALIYNENNYLMYFSSKIMIVFINYRVDKMDLVKLEDEPISQNAIISSESISSYT